MPADFSQAGYCLSSVRTRVCTLQSKLSSRVCTNNINTFPSGRASGSTGYRLMRTGYPAERAPYIYTCIYKGRRQENKPGKTIYSGTHSCAGAYLRCQYTPQSRRKSNNTPATPQTFFILRASHSIHVRLARANQRKTTQTVVQPPRPPRSLSRTIHTHTPLLREPTCAVLSPMNPSFFLPTGHIPPHPLLPPPRPPLSSLAHPYFFFLPHYYIALRRYE